MLVGPLIVFLMQRQLTTSLLAHCTHSSDGSHGVHVAQRVLQDHQHHHEVQQQRVRRLVHRHHGVLNRIDLPHSQFIRIPMHFLLAACTLWDSDTLLHLHLVLAVFMACSVRVYNFVKISHFLKDKGKTIDIKVSVQSLDRKLYILSFFQMTADLVRNTQCTTPRTPALRVPASLPHHRLPVQARSSHQHRLGTQHLANRQRRALLRLHARKACLHAQDLTQKDLGRRLRRHLPQVTRTSANTSVFTALILSQLNVLSLVHLDAVHTKHFLIISLIVSIVSIYGDFIESFLKRVADVKDSGNFFPGHGGVLDRVTHMLH